MTDLLSQRYQLALDLNLTSYLTAAGGGSLLDRRAWTVLDGNDVRHRTDTGTFYGRLDLNAPTLSGSLGADRTEQRTRGVPGLVTESYTGYLLWRPTQLPEIDVRGAHVDSFDTTRTLRDTTNDAAALGIRYETINSDLRYRLSFDRTNDHLNAAESSTVEHDLLGTRSDKLFDDRVTTYLNASVQARSMSVTANGPNATLSRQQLPVGGLSGVETAPATPENIALVANPALVDGNVVAATTVNVGYGPTLLGDRDVRDVGARFGDLMTTVNRIYVWVDRPLTSDLGAALAATVQVWESDDNQRWTSVPLASPAFLSPFENRLEISIPEKSSRLLKVTIRPLAIGLTTDLAYRDVLVTELQFFHVTAADAAPHHSSTVTTIGTGFARTLIVRSFDFAHDVTASVGHDTDSDQTRYSVVNGLSAQHPVWRTVSANGRLERQDADSGRGHDVFWRWSAGVVGRPLPTAYWSLVYSGNKRDRDDAVAHSLTALGRADLYDGITGQASGSVSQATQGTRTGQSGQASATVSMTPNRWVTLTTGGVYSRTRTTDSADGSAVVAEYGRVDGSLSLTPVPAISATGTVSRILTGPKPTTFGTVQANYFPLRGELQLSVGYSKTFDTAAEATTEVLTPMIRWNLRRGVSLTASYTLLKNVAPVQILTSRAITATLLITL